MTRYLLFMALLAAVLRGLSPAPASAASFDCSRTGSPVEQMICDDPELSFLDDMLAEAYRDAQSVTPEPDVLRAEQQLWLRARRDNCPTRQCLKTVYQKRIGRLHDLGGFTAANGMSEDALSSFLRAVLQLPEDVRLMFAPLRSATQPAAWRIAFFASWRAGGTHLGVVDVSGAQPYLIHSEPYPCECEALESFRAVRLLEAERDFIVAEYIPRTGTCVAVMPMEILRVDDRGAFRTVWEGTTYTASSADVEIGDITFTDLSGGGQRGILRSARQIRCDDDCFCREGTPIREYVELFVWDPAAMRFRLAE